MSSPVSTGLGDLLQLVIPSWYIISQLGQLSLASPGLLNRLPALISWGKGRNITCAWQITLCDHIWHVSSCSSEVDCRLLYSVYLLTQRMKYHTPFRLTMANDSIFVPSCHWYNCLLVKQHVRFPTSVTMYTLATLVLSLVSQFEYMQNRTDKYTVRWTWNWRLTAFW